MRFRKLTKNTNVTNKRVLVRVSANVPIVKGKVLPDGALRLEKLMPVLLHLVRKRAKVILISHIGRPQGRRDASLSMASVAKILAGMLQRDVRFVADTLGTKAHKAVGSMQPGDIVFLENLKFYRGEIANTTTFAKKLSELGDIMINEAFADSHRSHASIVSLPLHLPSYAGFQFQEEVATLEKVLKNPKKPLGVIIGGAKITSKLGAIEGLLSNAHVIVLGGDIANPLINPYRQKQLTKKELRAVRTVQKHMRLNSSIVTPEDVVVKREGRTRTIPTSQIMAKDTIIDIGSESTARILSILQTTNTVVWNGPLGIFETAAGKRSSVALARFLARRRCTTIIGGGETTALLTQLRLTRQYTFISTGGGAMLAFLSGDELPGIKALRN